jgi:hypothetical protein
MILIINRINTRLAEIKVRFLPIKLFVFNFSSFFDISPPLVVKFNYSNSIKIGMKTFIRFIHPTLKSFNNYYLCSIKFSFKKRDGTLKAV